MASFVILKIAKEIQDKSPEAAVILRRDRYMDDLIHSCSSPQDAWNRIQQLETALNTGSFKIKEWFCSSKEIRDKLSSSNRESPDGVTVSLDGEGETKTLGLGWNSHTDVLKFSVKSLETERYTKTIRARIEMQNLWRSKQYDWDDPLPDELSSVWNGLFRELQELQNVEFPRCIKPEGAVGLPVLNVFSDASSVAYGAVAYLLWNTPSGPTCSLISSKARVAPLRQNTIPRLELMAALVSSRLAKTIEEELKIKPRETILCSNSKIVLHWIRSESLTLKPFVGVRVSEIQSTWDPANFRHVPSGENPGDDLSRGISVSQMTGRWMNGPEFLKRPRNEWPNEEIKEIPLSEDPEVRKKSFSLYAFTHTEPIVNPADFSNWPKLIRITAYCLRFVNRISKRDTCANTYESIVLQPSELESAERHWIILAQNQVPDWKERYRDLTPFIEDRIICVGGRLGRSQLPYDQVHLYYSVQNNTYLS
ncbi:hypothetical protein SNE40_022250 [Patella caerulea]|uniref:Uncharacterized protein n=1 Tax=Patella caerulea TaxID=87958 RepID=A0AAN8GFF5_PATCE